MAACIDSGEEEAEKEDKEDGRVSIEHSLQAVGASFRSFVRTDMQQRVGRSLAALLCVQLCAYQEAKWERLFSGTLVS